jgi:hypothetical protein
MLSYRCKGESMKDQEVKESFIKLRACGRSYSSIASELRVSKKTLISWSKLFRADISNFRHIRMEALKEEFLLSQEKRIEGIGIIFAKLLAELKERDVKEISTDKLFKMYIDLDKSLDSSGSIIFKDEISLLDTPLVPKKEEVWIG